MKAQLQDKNSTINNLKKHISVLNEKSNLVKAKHDIDVIKSRNIELELYVARLRNENETLKRHHTDLRDSIKETGTKNLEHTTSLMVKNDKFKDQIQGKGFTTAAIRNEVSKLTRNSVNTKFAKPSILGKPVLQSSRNHSVVRQPNAVRYERTRFSKTRFAPKLMRNKF